MTSLSRRILAIVLTALMVVECVPAVAWAEVGERIADAAGASDQVAQTLAETHQSDTADPLDESADADVSEVTALADDGDEDDAVVTGDETLPFEGTPIETALKQAQDEAFEQTGDESVNLLADNPGVISDEPAAGDEPAANAEPASASDDGIVVTDDSTAGGLVTHLPDGWSLEYAPELPSEACSTYDSSAWKPYPEWDKDDRTVWKADSTGISKWTVLGFQVLPKKADGTIPEQYYLTYDYILAYGEGGTFLSAMLMNETVDQLDTGTNEVTRGSSYAATDTGDEYESDEAITADKWKTGVLSLSSSYPVAAIIGSLMNSKSNARMYLSNIKIYESPDELPDDCLYTVEVEHNPSVGYVELGVANTHVSKNKVDVPVYDLVYTLDANELDKVKFPIGNKYMVTFVPTDPSARFDGWWASAEASEPISRDNPYSPNSAITKTGSTHLQVHAKRLAEVPEFSLYKMTPGDSEWTPVEVTEEDSKVGIVKNEWYRCEKWRADDEASAKKVWRIELDKSKSTYDSIEVTDNGKPVDLKNTYDNPEYKDHEYYDLEPNNETHHIQFTIHQNGYDDNVAHVILWPTLTWEQAFGVTDEETGESYIPGATQDNTFDNTDLNWFVERTLDNENLLNKRYAWLYDSETAKQFADDEHEICFTNSTATEDAITEAVLDVSDDSVIEFDYNIKVDEGAEAGDTPYLFICTDKYTIKEDWVVEPAEGEAAQGTNGWKHAKFDLDEFWSPLHIRFENPGPNHAVCAIANFKVIGQAVNASIKASSKNGGQGTVTVNGKAATNKYYLNDSLRLEAKPNSGNQFIGWFDATTNKLISDKTSYRYTVKGDFKIEARFVALNNGDVALVYDNTYSTLKAAADAATSGQTILLLNKDTKVDDAVTVKKGVTLLLRLSDGDRSGYTKGKSAVREAWKNGTQPYQTLTVNPGGSLTVNGKLTVGGTRHAENQAAQAITSGAYAQLVNNGTVTIASGGTFTVNGLVTGTGTITAESGSTSTVPYTVNDYSGGTNTEALYNAKDFPFHLYAAPNVQCPYVVKSGATVMGSASLYFWSSIYTQDVPLVGKSGGEGLILLGDGAELTATYQDDKVLNAIYGSRYLADFGKQTLTLEGPVTAGVFKIDSYGSTGKYLCLPYNFDIVVKSGTLTVPSQRLYRVMPGSEVRVNEGAKLVVQNGGGLDVTNGWQQTALSSSQYPTTDQLKRDGFSTAGSLMVDGTLQIDKGGTFTGVAQTSGTKGVLKVASGATLSKTYSVGASTEYGNNKTSYSSKAQARVGSELTDLKTGTSYAAADAVEWQLPSYTMGTTVTTNQTMHGSWGIPKIVFHFNDDDRTQDKEVLPEPGTTVTLEIPREREGLRFDGWYTTKDFQGDPVGESLAAPGGTVELWGKWSEIVYSLHFDPDGGTFTSPEAAGDSYATQVKFGGSLSAMPTVEKDGYKFGGWYEQGQEAETLVEQLKDVRADHVLKAHWTPDDYGIAYKSEDGSDLASMKDVTWPEGQPNPTSYTIEGAIEVGAPTRVGYDFAGWTWQGQDDPQQRVSIEAGRTGDLELTAHWAAKTFEVALDPSGGTLSGDRSVTVTYGQKYPELPKPVLDGWIFSNWEVQADDDTQGMAVKSGDEVKILPGASLKAVWTHGEYTIEYKLEGGDWGSATEAQHPGKFYVDTETFTIPDPVRTGYEFKGWNDGSTTKTGYQVERGTKTSLTLTAVWEPVRVGVTLDAKGGELAGGEGALSLTYDRTVGESGATLPTPKRLGYDFGGWFFKGTDTELASDTKVDFTEARTAEAKWDVHTYSITYTFGAGGGFAEADEASKRTEYTVEDSFELPVPVREGHAFKEWTAIQAVDGAKGEGTDLAKGVVAKGTTGDLEFKADSEASWTLNRHALTWDYAMPEGTARSESSELGFGSTFSAPADPELKGYRFDGWDDGTGTLRKHGELTDVSMPDDDLTYEAKWTSYLDLLDAIDDFSDDGALAEARGHYALLNPTQKAKYDASAAHAGFINAIAAFEARAIDAELKAAIGSVNESLERIAELTVDPTNDHTLLVKLIDPHTKAKDMLSNGFLSKLFGSERVSKVDVEGQLCEKDQMSLMKAVAWAAYGKGRYADTKAFYDWLIQQQDVLEISILLGTGVHANLIGETAEGAVPQTGYDVKFWDDTHAPGHIAQATITYETGQGSPVPSTTLRPGELLTKPDDPSRTGYRFDGWYEDEACETAPFPFAEGATMPEEDLTLHAKWTPKTYTIAFEGGLAGERQVKGEMADVTATYDETLALPECDFEPIGYNFTGWVRKGTEERIADRASVRNLLDDSGTVTLVAQWEPMTFTLALDPGEGAEVDGKAQVTATMTYDATYADAFGGELPDATRSGYSFVGWFDGPGDSARQVSDTETVAVTADQTLYAHWNVNGDIAYKVRYLQEDLEPDPDGTYGYTEVKTVEGKGSIFEPVKIADVGYTGFELHDRSELSGMIEEDGSTVFEVHYDRVRYSVTWEVEGQEPVEDTYRYGEAVEWRAKGADRATAWDTDAWHGELTEWATRDSVGKLTSVDEFPTASANATYYAELEKSYEAETPDHQTTWRTLGIAMEKAPKGTADDPTIVSLHGGEVALEGDLTVPSGIMLLVPYALGDTGYDTVDNLNQHQPGPPVADGTPSDKTGAKGTEFSKLVVPDGKTLTVDGRVLVNALIGRDGDGHYDHDVTGGYGHLELGKDAEVVVRKGGTFDCHGYVDGSGSVTCEPGGTVGDLYVVRNWRGGSEAAAIFPKVYPYNEYDCHNIEVPVTIQAGGTLEGLVTMHASGAYYSTRFPLVDPANGLIRQTSGSTVRTYDGERETWSVAGGAEFSRSTLYIIQMDLSTGSFTYPIDGDMDFVLANGDYTFSEDYKFLTGATVTCRDADVTVAPDSAVVLYEEFDDPVNTDNTQYPERDAAWMSLDAKSSLTNHGSFAGKVRATAPSVHHGSMDVSWDVTTLEANGYYNTKPFGQETREIVNGIDITCPGHSFGVSIKNELLWDGAESEFHPVEEMADIIGSGIAEAIAGGSGGGEDGEETTSKVEGLEVETKLEEDGSITMEVALNEERGEGSAVGSAEDAVGALLRALAARADVFYSASTMTGEDDYTAILAEGISGYDIRMFTERLGIVEKAKAQAEAKAEERAKAEKDKAAGQALALAEDASASALAETIDPIGADLNGVSGKIKVKGTEDYPVETTVTLVFRADEVESEPEPEPEERPVLALYRLYNPYDGQHLYTTDGNEYDSLERIGWRQEGIESWQPEVEAKVASLDAAEPASAQTVVYRLYNPNNGDHLYTAKASEATALARVGWDLEGVAFASAEPTDGGAIPVYRLWNPYMTDRAGLGSHIFTSKANEYKELGKLGWIQEDVYWYAASAPNGGA